MALLLMSAQKSLHPEARNGLRMTGISSEGVPPGGGGGKAGGTEWAKR